MVKKMQFEISENLQPKFYFGLRWFGDVDSYVEGVDDYAEIVIRASNLEEAKKIFNTFIKAIKKRKVRLIE